MTPETVKAIQEALTSMFQSIGASGSAVFELAIKRNYFFAWVDGFVFILFLVLTVAAFIYKKKNVIKEKDYFEEYGVLVWFGITLLLAISLGFMFQAADRFINPELRAGTDVIEMLKGSPFKK